MAANESNSVVPSGGANLAAFRRDEKKIIHGLKCLAELNGMTDEQTAAFIQRGLDNIKNSYLTTKSLNRCAVQRCAGTGQLPGPGVSHETCFWLCLTCSNEYEAWVEKDPKLVESNSPEFVLGYLEPGKKLGGRCGIDKCTYTEAWALRGGLFLCGRCSGEWKAACSTPEGKILLEHENYREIRALIAKKLEEDYWVSVVDPAIVLAPLDDEVDVSCATPGCPSKANVVGIPENKMCTSCAKEALRHIASDTALVKKPRRLLAKIGKTLDILKVDVHQAQPVSADCQGGLPSASTIANLAPGA
ncbi:hypothetical protein BKA70DRAFT_1554680 [Coprinopsis sp. MPI-PUGE-AT-0042]|nr:hypothetical protein BKA70DRAFT_1554680 [Coprinopsis sp. MPI-PUGE-AT-0042]